MSAEQNIWRQSDQHPSPKVYGRGGQARLILFLGPSGAGKSTIIRALVQLDPQFRYVPPYTTRPLRESEVEKIHVSRAQMDYLETQGQLLARNHLYGYDYGTPRQIIGQHLDSGIFPCLDWPIHRLDLVTAAFPGRVFRTYVAPPSIEVLEKRLTVDGRDPRGIRAAQAKVEFAELRQGRYDKLIDLFVCSHDGAATSAAQMIRHAVKPMLPPFL